MTEDPLPAPAPAPDATAPGPGSDTAAPDGPRPDDRAPHRTGRDTPEPGDPSAAPQPERRRRGRPKGSTSAARTTRVVELTLTVSGGADGEWQAELKQGSAWITRGLPVTAAAVARAAQELSPELAEPIDAAIGAARERRAARVAELEAELEQARKALAELDT